MCFSETDNINEELMRIHGHGRQLWCGGKEAEEPVICVDSVSLSPSKIEL